jgi:hypothetical protein
MLAGMLLLAVGYVPAGAAGAGAANTHRRAAVPLAQQPVVTLTAGGQTFDIQGRPGDSRWLAVVKSGLTAEVPALEDLTGLTAPGGTIAIAEVDDGLNNNGISYDPASRTLGIPQSAGPSIVANALARIWFNSTFFSDRWVNEGLAAFAEQVAGTGSYLPCSAMPAYPGAGNPNLAAWATLDAASTIAEQNVADWQVGASCAFFAEVAEAMGPANFRNVLVAAAARRPAYGLGSQAAAGASPVTVRQLLDLIDEVGMVPASAPDPDMAQKLLAGFGLLDTATLASRSQARAAYHALTTRAGSWSIAPAIRAPLQSWDFAAAEAAMTTAGEILDVRDAVEKTIPSYSPNGSAVQTGFETAAIQDDLESLQSVMQKMFDASGTIAHATGLRDGSRSLLQTIGLIGTDTDTPIKHALADLQSVEPGKAQSDAQLAIDEIDGASNVGLLRAALAVGLLGLTLILAFWLALTVRRRRRRRRGGTVAGDVAPPEETDLP